MRKRIKGDRSPRGGDPDPCDETGESPAPGATATEKPIRKKPGRMFYSRHTMQKVVEFYIRSPKNPYGALKKAGVVSHRIKAKWDVLKNSPEFWAAVEERRDDLVRELKIDTATLAEEYKFMAFSNLSAYYRETPEGLEAKSLGEVDPRPIKDFVETENGEGKKMKRKYIFHDKLAVMQSLRDMLGLDAPKKSATVAGIFGGTGNGGGIAEGVAGEVQSVFNRILKRDSVPAAGGTDTA